MLSSGGARRLAWAMSFSSASRCCSGLVDGDADQVNACCRSLFSTQLGADAHPAETPAVGVTHAEKLVDL